MSNIIITESQLRKLKSNISEGSKGSYMAKQQLFTIATLAYKMWEQMEEGEQLEDWMESKVAQSEQSIVSVVKSFMYDEAEEELKGMEKLNYDELVIGT
jgi:hypothetical protein|tara:strand:+ start:165 stop:461 length:297 start_codon:yes stop_codon:yes gene_type:complete